MSILDDFKIEHRSVAEPYITVADYGITFPTATINCLNKSPYIHVYFDDVKKRVAFQACEKDADAFPFFNPSVKNTFVRWSNYRIRDHICRLLEIEPTKKGIRLNGEYLEDENVLLFNLSEHIK